MNRTEEYRFRLQSSPKRKQYCPLCGKRTLTLYVNTETGNPVGQGIGRCDREMKCGYHESPYGRLSNRPLFTGHYLSTSRKLEPIGYTEKSCDYIERAIVEQSKSCFEANNLAKYLTRILGQEVVSNLVDQFQVGTAAYGPGASVFWQIDHSGHVRTGKIILYNPASGHRIKTITPPVQWAHTLMKIPDYKLDQCLFGEHQLATESTDKPIAIVESEKTAIIASAQMPHYIWMATGGSNNLSPEKLMCLKERNVLLWPDLGAYDKWAAKMKAIQRQVGCNLEISDVLERNATDEERRNGLDIADYLVNDTQNNLLAQN